MDEFRAGPLPASPPVVSDLPAYEDFQIPGPSRRVDAWLATALALVHGLAWAPFFVTLLIYVPRYKKMFADFGLKLPWVTEFLIDLSDMFAEAFPFVPAILSLCVVLDGWLLYCLRRWSRPLSWVWFVLLLIAGIVAFFIVRLAVMLPMVELMEGLAK